MGVDQTWGTQTWVFDQAVQHSSFFGHVALSNFLDHAAVSSFFDFGMAVSTASSIASIASAMRVI